MKRINLRDGLLWLLGFIPLLIPLAALRLGYDLGHPFGGFAQSYLNFRDILTVEPATPLWWSGLAVAGLRSNDQLLEINGQPYDAQAKLIFAEAFNNGERQVTIKIQRNGTILEKAVTLEIFSWDDFLDLFIPNLINGICFWAVAFIVYRSQPADPVNRLFAFSCGLIAVSQILSSSELFSDPRSNVIITSLVSMIWKFAASFIGISIIHFITLFPHELPPWKAILNRGVQLSYGLALVVSLSWISVGEMWTLGELSPMGRLLDTTSSYWAMSTLGLGWLLFALRFLNQFVTSFSKSRRELNQALIIILGVALTFPFVSAVVLRGVIGTTYGYHWQGLDFRYLVISAPLAFAVVILRYRSFQGTSGLIHGILILAGSALVASLTSWLWWLSLPPSIQTTVRPPFLPLWLCVTLPLSLFWNSLTSAKGFLARVFQWPETGYNIISNLVQRFSLNLDFKTMPQLITQALVSELRLEQVALWHWDSLGKLSLSGQAGHWPQALPPTLDPQASHNLPELLLLRSPEQPIPAWLQPLQQVSAVELVLPLASPTGLIGLLALGKNVEEEVFIKRDLEAISLIGQVVKLFLITGQQIEALNEMSRTLEHVQEDERYRIAQDLHDTIQQSLNGLAFHLYDIRQKVPSDPAAAQAKVADCLGDIQQAIQTLYQIRYNLDMNELKHSFTQPLQNMLAYFEQRSGVQAHLQAATELDEWLPLKARGALYRVVEQAFQNTIAHAQASQFSVALTCQTEQVQFVIHDNGRGSSEAERAEAAAQGHIGIASMKTRIENLGGKFSMSSSPQAGTQITGWIPGSNASA